MDRVASSLRTSVGALMIDFSNRDLGLLGIATVCIAFATGCFTIALGVYGFEAHGAVGVGLVALIRFLPGSLASPFIGLLIDRLPRRTVLLGSSIANVAVLAAATAAAALGAPTWVVFVFPALFAIASCGYGPAHAALTPTLAKTPQQLSASNVTHSAMESAGSLSAALVAGILLGSTSPGFVFGVAAAATAAVVALVIGVKKDSRPEYLAEDEEVVGALRELTVGMRTLLDHPALRLASATLVLLYLFQGFAAVLVVVMALDLLGLGQGSVGFLNAAWGIGALIGAMSLAMLLDRGRLVVAIARGSLLLGGATMLPGISPEPALAYVGWLGIGIGFVFVEVGAKTLMQRLGSDETLGRVIGSLEAARQAAMALGSVGAIAFVEVIGVRGALIALGALMPVFVIGWWTRLRAHEVGAPVAEGPYRLLRDDPIFAPLPVATLERLSHDLVPIDIPAHADVIVQGETGDRFFLIDEGEVEVLEDGVFRRREGPGESFGEIALLHDVPRTATVRTTTTTRLLALDQDQFLLAVTGHRRSHQRARTMIDERWQAPTAKSGEGALEVR
jgi:MFS family permease